MKQCTIVKIPYRNNIVNFQNIRQSGILTGVQILFTNIQMSFKDNNIRSFTKINYLLSLNASSYQLEINIGHWFKSS